MLLEQERGVDRDRPAGGRERKRLWSIAAGLALVVAGVVACSTPRADQLQGLVEKEEHARAEAAAQQLASWVRQAGFEPTAIEVALAPALGMARGNVRVDLTPRVVVNVEQVPVAVTWEEPRSQGSRIEDLDDLEIGDRTVELGEATRQEGRATARFDCGPTSLHVLVDARGALDVDELPSDGGRNDVVAVATGLAETVPCPVRHPDPEKAEARALRP